MAKIAPQTPPTQKKGLRKPDRDYMGYIAQLPCVACLKEDRCFNYEVQVAHLRYGDPDRGKPPTGMQERPDDKWTTPLCKRHHDQQHSMSERSWWQHNVQVDPIDLCKALNNAYPVVKTGLRAITEAIRKSVQP